MKYYAGIGAREIPPEIKKELSSIGLSLAQRKYCLRSGGAAGADSAFEWGAGCCSLASSMEIFLPWKNFNNNLSQLYLTDRKFKELEPLARTIYLAWDHVTIGVKKLHARNIQQILGETPGDSKPSEFVVCWTDRPSNQYGGTRFGMKVAEECGIPVYNLFDPDEKERFYEEILK